MANFTVINAGGKLAEAAATWERLIDTYPSAEQSYRGLFLAGISYYRAADYPKALTVFQRLLVLSTTPGEQASAYLWIGKTHEKLGRASDAQNAWQLAQGRHHAAAVGCAAGR